MSVSLEVFLRAENLPSHKEWQQAIDSEGIDLRLDDIDPASHEGFWPCQLNGTECGFEYLFSKADFDADERPHAVPRQGWWARLFGSGGSSEAQKPEQIDGLQQRIGNREHVVEFIWHSSLDDGRSAAFAAAALAKITDGILFDPQSGELTQAIDAVAIVRSQDRTEREMKMEQAVKKWETSTHRRCPECGAPCPEYRPTCFVCRYAIGRA